MHILQFGTDGIRGKADLFPFTKDALFKLGHAIAQWSKNKYKTENPSVLIGHDTRVSCRRIKEALKTGLHHLGIESIDCGVLPTPAIYQIIKNEEKFHFGIVISASHNHHADNGIKILDASTCKLNRTDEETIIDFFGKAPERNPSTEITSIKKAVTQWSDAKNLYKDYTTSHFPKDFLRGLTIVLDCAHGATYQTGPAIFEALGAKVVPLCAKPNGYNINHRCGSLYPDILKDEITKHSADFGFAFDGDGDRVIAMNKAGEIKDGDDLLSILLTHQDFSSSNQIVGTVMTNHGFDLYLQSEGKKLIRTKVGDKYVVEALDQQKCQLGGEASGHIIIKPHLSTGDGIFVALKTIEAMLQNNNLEMKSFQKYPQVLINTSVSNKKNLSTSPLKEIIEGFQQKLHNGRIVARYSGTENLLRIMAEDDTYESASEVASELSKQLHKELTL
jgi:phosphoglucosamine mutase